MDAWDFRRIQTKLKKYHFVYASLEMESGVCQPAPGYYVAYLVGGTLLALVTGERNSLELVDVDSALIDQTDVELHTGVILSGDQLVGGRAARNVQVCKENP